MNNKESNFNFKELLVWQKSVKFADEVLELAECINTKRKHYRLFEQIESSSTSISMNIAEGKGRFSKKEFIQFLYIAIGSLYETVTLLNIFRNGKWITDSKLNELEKSATEIAKMINSLINSIRNSINK